MGGATTINGSGGTDGLLRNIDQNEPRQEGLGLNSVEYSTFPLGDAQEQLEQMIVTTVESRLRMIQVLKIARLRTAHLWKSTKTRETNLCASPKTAKLVQMFCSLRQQSFTPSA